MSPRLTLLFWCEQHEFCPLLISALEAAEFHLVMVRNKQEAHKLLSDLTVDAVLICESKPLLGGSVCAALKRRAPRTPIFLFTSEHQQQEPYPGIYSVLHADPQDEVLTRAVALLLREFLTISGSHRITGLRAGPPPSAQGPTPHPAM